MKINYIIGQEIYILASIEDNLGGIANITGTVKVFKNLDLNESNLIN